MPRHAMPQHATPRPALSCPGLVLPEDDVIRLAADAALIMGTLLIRDSARTTDDMKATLIAELVEGRMCFKGFFSVGRTLL